jgi:hypothetical protein
VVEVQMGQQQVDPSRAPVQELEAKLPRAGAGVEHENRVVVERHLDA